MPEDSNGYVSFGVVLHTTYKNGHGNFDDLEMGSDKERKVFQKIKKVEIKTLAHIIKRDIKKTVKPFKYSKSSTRFFPSKQKKAKGKRYSEIKELHSKRVYNPLLFILNSRIMFRAWKNFSENNWEKIKYHKQHGLNLEEIEISSVNDSQSDIQNQLDLNELDDLGLMNGESIPQNKPDGQSQGNSEKSSQENGMNENEANSESKLVTSRLGSQEDELMGDVSEDAELPGEKAGGVRSMSFFMGDPQFQEIRREKKN